MPPNAPPAYRTSPFSAQALVARPAALASSGTTQLNCVARAPPTVTAARTRAHAASAALGTGWRVTENVESLVGMPLIATLQLYPASAARATASRVRLRPVQPAQTGISSVRGLAFSTASQAPTETQLWDARPVLPTVHPALAPTAPPAPRDSS